MNPVSPTTLCFGCICTTSIDSSADEHLYQSVYKPLVSTLYNLPELPFTFAFDGPLLEWMEGHHPEFFMILEEMVSRKQVEILGGGYYAPYFPLLPPADRVGQIEMLTTQVRKNFGKRPRGAWLESSAWEPSLVSSLTSCGVEYVLLDRAMIASAGFKGVDGTVPVTVEDNGKTILAMPLDYRPAAWASVPPADFLGGYLDLEDSAEERALCAFFSPLSLPALLAGGDDSPSWMQAVLDEVRSLSGAIALSVPGKALKRNRVFRKVYVQAGLSPNHIPAPGTRNHRAAPTATVKHALYASRAGMNLYAKMMYVHALVNQLRGDKARKKNAREELWKSQSGVFYRPDIEDPEGCDGASRLRNRAYKHLLLAEKATRLRGVFSPSIVSFDFDMDGLKEYLFQSDALNMYAHLLGGKLIEIDHFKTNRNYVDLCRDAHGCFVDHFLDRDEAASLAAGKTPASAPVFADKPYQETGVDSPKHEIQLRANGLFGPFQQPISLRKQYAFRSEGVQLQYILKNESPLNLTGSFAISVDLAVGECRGSLPQVSLYSGENRIEVPAGNMTRDDVEWVRVDDGEAKARFTLETNENASVTTLPGRGKDGEISGLRLYLRWNVDLGPNYETEKMVFLKIDTK